MTGATGGGSVRDATSGCAVVAWTDVAGTDTGDGTDEAGRDAGSAIGVTGVGAAAGCAPDFVFATAGAEAGRETEATLKDGVEGFEAAATDTTGATKGDPSDTGPGVTEIPSLSAAASPVELVEFVGTALATGAETAAGAVLVAGVATIGGRPAVFEGKGTNVSGAPGGGSVIGFATGALVVILGGVIDARLTGSNFRRTILSRTRASGTGCIFLIASIPSLAETRLKSRN